VSPTFSGLTVTGLSNLGSINALGSLFTGTTNVQGDFSVSNRLNPFGPIVKIGDVTSIPVGWGIGDLLVKRFLQAVNVYATQDIIASRDLILTRNASIGGAISDPDSAVTINDALTVSGGTTTLGALNAGATTTTGLTTSGNLTIGGAVSTTAAPLEINSDVTITGHLKATSTGSFYYRSCPTSSGTTVCGTTKTGPGATTGVVPAGSWGETDGYCDSNHLLLSCFGGFVDHRDSSKQWINALTTGTRATNRIGCYLNVQNNAAAAADIMLYVSCYNPNG